ncbi:hypothetical protein CR513_13714, partial [Mucuna pruriens]
MFLLHQCVDATHFEKIAATNTAKEIWDILEKGYTGGEKVKMPARNKSASRKLDKRKVQCFNCQRWDILLTNVGLAKENRREKLVEKHSGRSIKVLRTNGGEEYTSNEFEEFCVKNVIQHEVITPTPLKYNGLVEIRNWTMLDMARSMPKEKVLPHSFWVKLYCSICVECPTRRLKELMPEELLTRLADYGLFPDSAITLKGDLMHFALSANAEPLSFEEAMKEKVWKEAMMEELKAIEKNKT